ncbi:hypothetical protein NQZ70_10520 [Sorangium sp. Soce836]|nr:hypothetical protein NQZ70_10520 [Sorangium sp. Soce836]
MQGDEKGVPGEMLNAFRHHRGDRMAVLKSIVTKSPCSTPSGITAGIGPELIAHPLVLARVLNAFRHHGGIRYELVADLAAVAAVLNAFRHHGGERRVGQNGISRESGCSMPSGITAGSGSGTIVDELRTV